MNARELIDSGLLEMYVLGQASHEESKAVERMRSIEVQVHEELDAIEYALEAYALGMAVAPPTTVKGSVMDRIPKVVPIRTLAEPPTVDKGRPRNWLVAACVVGLMLSAGMNYVQFRQLHEIRNDLARLENDRSVLAQELQVQRASVERSNAQLAVVLDPKGEVIRLDGLGVAEGKSARIYWNKQEHIVHFDGRSMPELPKGKQYQLWALVDGQPVDAGMVSLESGSGLQRMKDVPIAQTFAVTIEKVGGSPSPDLSALVLMGQV